MCPEESRLAFAVYVLTGEAEHWWISMKSIMEERKELVTWEVFSRKFSPSTSPTTSNMLKRWSSYSWLKEANLWLSMRKNSSILGVSTPSHWMKNGNSGNSRTASMEIFGWWWPHYPTRTLQPWWRRWKWRWKLSTHTNREWEDHLGPGISMRRGKNPILGPILSLRGLGSFLPNRAGFSATGVGDRTRGMFSPACRLQEVQQMWQGRPLRQGFPYPHEDSDAYPSFSPSPEPAEEGGQQASSIGQSVRHD